MNHPMLIGVARAWLVSQLPTSVQVAGDLSPTSPVHFHGEQFVASVCFSPTNRVGRPRLEQLVVQADGRVPIFFVGVPPGLSTVAQSYADGHGVAVFTIDAAGEVEPASDGAVKVVAAVGVQRM
jgi:hypothetical protein